MTGLTSAVVALGDEMFKCGSTGDKQEGLKNSIIHAAFEHIKSSHITITYPDGHVRVKEIRWSAAGQLFSDWGDNFWLYGAESKQGKGYWKIGARLDTDPVIAALLKKAEHASKYGQVHALWSIYWQILLCDVMGSHHGDETIDLHLNAFDEKRLEKRAIFRQRDVIRV